MQNVGSIQNERNLVNQKASEVSVLIKSSRLRSLLPAEKSGERPRSVCLFAILNALCHLLG